MKKLFAALLIIISISLFFAVTANGEDGVTYTLKEDGRSYILSSYTKNEAEVRIAREYKGLPVGTIASGAFSGNISTYKIIIPDSIQTIESGAFSAMPSLYEFEAAGNYTAVNGVLFSADKKTLIRYPEARTGKYVIPQNTAVGSYAFSGSRLTELEAVGMISAGQYAFYMSDIKNVTLSPSLLTIGGHAFERSALEKVSVPGGTRISPYAFACCDKLVYADISGASLDGEGIFYSDTSLLAVSFPQDKTSVPSLTFAGCTSLCTAPIGKNVRSIGSKAFYGCVNLEHASCGTAKYENDTFGLCDKLIPDNNGFSQLKQKSADIVLKVGGSFTPAGTDLDLYTVSSAVSINNGRITAVFEGSAEVYAVSRRGGDCAVLKITVSDGAGVIESAHPYEKGTFRYTYTVPGDPARICVTFSSSDMLSSADAIKIQDKRGNLYGTFYGGSLAGKALFIDGDTVIITLVSITSGSYGFRISSACAVSSMTAVRNITLPDTVEISAGKQLKLDPAVTPADAYPAQLLYVSADKEVVYVSNDGTLYALSEGQTEITVYSEYYGVYAKCSVKVTDSRNKNEFEYEIKNNGAYITGYKGAAGVCTVPETIDGVAVRGINELAFAFSGITELYIPSSVSVFDASATDGNSSLHGIYVPEQSPYFRTVDGALYSKDGKTLYRVPCGEKGEFVVGDGVTTVHDGAFSCCFGLEKLVLSANVKDLTGKAFLNCANLRSITVSGGHFSVVDGVLYTADKNTLVYFPAGLNVTAYSVISDAKNIGAQAFNSAVNLKRLVLPTSVSYIDDTALCEACGITEISVSSTNAFFKVSNGALYESNKLKFVPKSLSGTFTVTGNTAKIAPYAFYNCAYITEIELPSSLTEIGKYAFGSCASLDRLYLPESVKTVGYDAFYGDSGLSVYIPAGASLEYLSDCTVLCGKNTSVCAFCTDHGLSYEYAYMSVYGLYTVCTPVNAGLYVLENKDPVLLSKYMTAAGRNVKAFSVYLLSDTVKLPLGEYALYRSGTTSKRYYYEDGRLSEIKQDAVSVYRRYPEHIIELYGDGFSPALAVKSLPDKLEYKIFENFDEKGLLLYYTDGYGLTSVIDGGIDVIYDFKSAGDKTVTVNYKNLSVSFGVTVKTVPLTGTVKITGTAKYGGTLFADTSGAEPADAEFCYQWYSNGSAISGANGKTYKPEAKDIGKMITVTVSALPSVTGELTSAAAAVTKASSPAPPKPEIASSDLTSVALKKVEGCEYRLSSSGEFTDNNVFENLKPGETYVFCQRYKETDTTEASDISSFSYQMQRDFKLLSDKYFINSASGAVSMIEPGTSVKTLCGGFKDSEYVAVYKDGKQMSDNDTVGTGCEVRLTVSGKVYDKCVCVMTGDVNGDGKITITDYLKIKERIQNGTAFAKEKEYASDVNGDGKVTITDYLRLKYCIQNGVKPEQNRY